MTEGDTSDQMTAEEVLFREPGGTWWWLLAGPAAGGAMMAIQLSGGAGVQFGVPAIFMILVSGFLAIQIKAARIHTSVELTPTTLRQGTELVDHRRHRPDLSGTQAPRNREVADLPCASVSSAVCRAGAPASGSS